MNISSQRASSIHPELPDTAIPSRRDGFHVSSVPCCKVLQDENNVNVLKLSDCSVLIWELCNGEISVGDMLSLLKESYPEAADEITRDVYRSLDTFKEYEVIDIAGV